MALSRIMAEAGTAACAAWAFTALLAWARCMPKRVDGRPAVSVTLTSLFLLTWAGAPFLDSLLGLAPTNPFGYVFVGMLAAIALATFAVPLHDETDEWRPTWRYQGARFEALPSRAYSALVSVTSLAIFARHVA